jgi:hypothetical protein
MPKRFEYKSTVGATTWPNIIEWIDSLPEPKKTQYHTAQQEHHAQLAQDENKLPDPDFAVVIDEYLATNNLTMTLLSE